MTNQLEKIRLFTGKERERERERERDASQANYRAEVVKKKSTPDVHLMMTRRRKKEENEK